MTGYTKLFADIITSTVWQEPNDCRVLWITMLALKNRDHVVTATIPWLAKTCNISPEQCAEYLEKFQRPDKFSRSKEFEGRRIEVVEGGWLILNGEKYRDRLNAEDRKEQVRKAVARHREKQKKPGRVNVEEVALGTGRARGPMLTEPRPPAEREVPELIPSRDSLRGDDPSDPPFPDEEVEAAAWEGTEFDVRRAIGSG